MTYTWVDSLLLGAGGGTGGRRGWTGDGAGIGDLAKVGAGGAGDPAKLSVGVMGAGTSVLLLCVWGFRLAVVVGAVARCFRGGHWGRGFRECYNEVCD